MVGRSVLVTLLVYLDPSPGQKLNFQRSHMILHERTVAKKSLLRPIWVFPGLRWRPVGQRYRIQAFREFSISGIAPLASSCHQVLRSRAAPGASPPVSDNLKLPSVSAVLRCPGADRHPLLPLGSNWSPAGSRIVSRACLLRLLGASLPTRTRRRCSIVLCHTRVSSSAPSRWATINLYSSG